MALLTPFLHRPSAARRSLIPDLRSLSSALYFFLFLVPLASGFRLTIRPSFITQNGVCVALASRNARSDARRSARVTPATWESVVFVFLFMIYLFVAISRGGRAELS
jgi:hypothetical protein